MIQETICNSVLTIGNRCDKPDGGIAQVLYSYRKYVFKPFIHVVNYKRGSPFYKMWVSIVGYIKVFSKLVFNRKIKIVHIHTAAGNGFVRNIFFVDLAKFFRKKVVLHIHSGRFNEYYINNRKLVDRVFRKCSAIVVLTEKIKSFYEGLGCKNLYVINNIIEPPVLKELNANDSCLHCLYLGVITKTKGIYDLIDVIKEHKEELLGKFFLHVGGNKEVDVLKALIRDCQLDGLVKYEGWVSGDKKVELLNRCDVFILPSYTEGLPISILEAQSYGLFTIATNVGGIPEIVNNTNGILFNPQDKDTLYSIIKTIDTNRALLNNKKTIIQHTEDYLPDRVSAQLEEMYNSISCF